jgi:hypothetical protein
VSLKSFFGLLLLAVLLSVGWHYRDGPAVQGWLHPAPEQQAAARFESVEAPVREVVLQASQLISRPALHTPRVHKCLRGEQVLYTDERCATGFVEHRLSRGTFTVLPSPQRKEADGNGQQLALGDRVADRLAPRIELD